MSFLLNPMAGRIGRLKWWLSQIFIVFILIVGFIAISVMHIGDNPETLIDNPQFEGKIWLLIIFTGYVNLCACLNRLRDSGRSGWWYFAHFIPFIGAFIIIYFCGMEKGEAKMSFAGFGEIGSGVDADDIIRRYQEGQSQAAHYTPPAPQPSHDATPARPRPTLQTPQGFGKRKGFQGNWG